MIDIVLSLAKTWLGLRRSLKHQLGLFPFLLSL